MLELSFRKAPPFLCLLSSRAFFQHRRKCCREKEGAITPRLSVLRPRQTQAHLPSVVCHSAALALQKKRTCIKTKNLKTATEKHTCQRASCAIARQWLLEVAPSMHMCTCFKKKNGIKKKERHGSSMCAPALSHCACPRAETNEVKKEKKK
jgi:hypothetical protein